MSTSSGNASPNAKISSGVALMLAVVMLAGTFAAFTVSPLLLATTFLVSFMIVRAARGAPKSGAALPQFPELPPSLRATVDRTIDQLPEGDARRLLFNAVVQARPLLAPHAAALDEQQERATRDNVCSLVEACCTTALEMARLDLASAGDQANGSDEAKHVAAARELLAGRLSHAATALSSLYVAGVEHGSPASDRVAELVGEINADASARREAATQMEALLHDGDATQS